MRSLAALVFRDTERMSGGFYIGTSIIIATVILLPIVNRRMRNKASSSNDLPSGFP